jgi:hypothetical protein
VNRVKLSLGRVMASGVSGLMRAINRRRRLQASQQGKNEEEGESRGIEGEHEVEITGGWS